ncbi:MULTISPECIES: TIR domain-containing protein [Neobacillus]|uniref:TIR domain-containing protein n=1 Tax=Neobacillus sedimentimangrovi TaxID=2699460 RepID=A0ABS8QMM8_9BACI|nr:TIR domain-containing protein [Neobacillus sedimentimangrovi]MCD4840076.1 TIR domain-containing protein [Neobacillus sedimentimangrovi]
MAKTYNLFISHSWSYSDQYEKLIDLLDKDENFFYKNYSVPKDDPIHNAKNDKELYEAIKKQISPSSVVLILAGVYSSYSKWIDKEIQIAKDLSKSIIAIEYWGSEKTSKKVKDNADRIVKWQSKSIIDSIKELG